MKFTIFKEEQPFVTLWLEAETPQGEEANPYDYLNTLVEALVESYKCDFKYKDEKGRESHVFYYKYWVDTVPMKEFPGLNHLITTGYQDANNKP